MTSGKTSGKTTRERNLILNITRIFVITLVFTGTLGLSATTVAGSGIPSETASNSLKQKKAKPQKKNNAKPGDTNVLDELNPFAPDIEQKLERLDNLYRKETEKEPWLEGINPLLRGSSGGCYRSACALYAYVRRSDQKLYLYENGNPHSEWLVSTGAPGHETPDFDRHPNGRIYDAYSSSTYPGGNYQGLGNMPYAVFIEGGFAIHGTTKGNFKFLGRRASHGCVRLHPDNAQIFNRLVRQYGVSNVWIQVGP